MEVIELTAIEYENVFGIPFHVFASTGFNLLNSDKCDKLYLLGFKDTKFRLGIILGARGTILYNPFSAPFGGFVSVSDDIKIAQIDNAIQSLEVWIKENKYTKVNIVLPPSFYNEKFINKQINSFYRADYDLANIDLNYQLDVNIINDGYMENIWRNARKNLKKSLVQNLEFNKVDEELYEKVYDIISENRKERGFPLRMSWEQVSDTIKIIKSDFFRVTKSKVVIASAIVFHVARDIVQVIYWGDLPEYSENKTMNFLSYELFKFYKKTGIRFVDIGPSTENSIPNHGLCEYKESIGCDISSKMTFTKNFE